MSDPATTTIAAADLDDAAQALVIDWADGARFVYPLAALRAACPCATCRDLREQARRPADPFRVLPSNLIQPDCTLAGVEPVGRYGMRLTRRDGHDTGIYTFEYLRELAASEDVARATAQRREDVRG